MTPEKESRLYQKIGEFVVSFQWIEHKIREIGWFCSDPWRKHWPPIILRDETNSELIKKVEVLFIKYLSKLELHDEVNRKIRFNALMSDCHSIRKYRNTLLHSAYIELKAGGEVVDIMRANPKIKFDGNTQDYVFDTEMLSEGSFLTEMTHMAQIALDLNFHYVQLLHWPQVNIHD